MWMWHLCGVVVNGMVIIVSYYAGCVAVTELLCFGRKVRDVIVLTAV